MAFLPLKNELGSQEDAVREAQNTLAKAEGADVSHKDDERSQVVVVVEIAERNAVDAFVEEHPEYTTGAQPENARVKKNGDVAGGAVTRATDPLGGAGRGETAGEMVAGSPHDGVARRSIWGWCGRTMRSAISGAEGFVGYSMGGVSMGLASLRIGAIGSRLRGILQRLDGMFS
jgi:hypothetical protein